MSPEGSQPSPAELAAPQVPAQTVAELGAGALNAAAPNNEFDVLLDPNADTSHLTVEGAAVRPEGYPVVTDPAELAQRQANTDAALRQQRVDDGKAPFVMPH